MPLPLDKRLSYSDLLKWPENERYELYDGRPVALASPSIRHQEVLTALLLQIGQYLKGKPCKVFPAPCDLRLFESIEDDPDHVDYVLQPDLMVVCDKEKIDQRGVRGAPNLVIEVLSESSRRYDMITKFSLYSRAGVPEYWIADPENQIVQVFKLEEGQYHAPDTYTSAASVPVGVLSDCVIELQQVFSE